MYRFGRYAAALCVSASLVAVSDYVLRADVPRVAAGTWAAAGEVAVPGGASSVALADGRVVVAGGESDSTPSSAISTYDPASGAWARVGDLATPRSAPALTVLKDGRVLVVGGTASNGPTLDIEIFDPAAGTSVHAGDMIRPRFNHAAATLEDGRVLIVGGSDGAAPMNLAEIFDPATGQSVGVPNVMATARVKATATTLLDGHVLVVGGNDGTDDLSSAEIFDPATSSFFNTGAMQTPRSGHVAVLLPHNNQVLIAGGMSAGAAVASAELYADWRDGFAPTPNQMSVARGGGIAAGLQPYDVAFVAGGGANTAEYYGYATVKTDKDDYAPYETVTISGSGWQPGEKVRLRVSEDADTHYDWELEAIADESGNIVNRDFYPRNDEVYHHIGMRFYLTAVGIGSQALTTFTDAMQTETSLASSLNPSSAGQSVTFTATVRMNDKHGNTDDWKPAVGGSVDFYDRTTATDVCDKNNDNGNYGVLLGTSPVNGGQATLSRQFLTAGTYPIQACYRGTGGQGTQDSFSTILQQQVTGAGQTAITVTADAKSKEYGAGDPALTYTITSGALASGDSFTGSLARVAGENVGTYAINQGTLSAGSNYTVTFVPANLTITARPVTVTAEAKSKTYGDADPALAYTGALLGTDSFTGNLVRDAGENVGTYAIKQGTLSAGSNYTLTFVGANLTINARPVTVTADAKSKIYGDADPALTYTGALHGTDTFTGNLARVTGEDVGTYAINQGTLSAGSNYALTFVGANLTINARPVTVTANPQSKVYGEADPALTFTGVLQGTDGFTGNLVREPGENVGTYAINQGTLSAGSNYALTFEGANLAITARPVMVTANPQSKVYGEADPELTYTAVLHGTDSFTGHLVREPGENVGTYAINQGTLSAGSNYALTFEGANLAITARPVTVTANPQSKVYGESDPALTYTGVLQGTDSFTGNLERVAGENVGTYAINLGTLSAGSNYALTFEGANLTITPRPVTITANPQSKTYGDDDPALTYTGVLHGTDSFTGNLARAVGENVGTYAINQGTLSAGSNYALTFVPANLTISKATLTVTADSKSRPYGDPNPSLTATFTGFKFAESLATAGVTGAPALATTATQSDPVGEYAITVGPGTLASGNYGFAYVNGTLTVTKASLTVTANDASRPYGVANPAFSGSYYGQKNGDTFTMSFSTTAATDSPVGSYAIVPSATGAAINNYIVTPVNGTLTILAWSLKGFYQPVGETSSIVSAPGVQPVVSGATVWNTIKGGQTVPLKFNIYRTVGGAQVTTLADAFTGAGFGAYQLPGCSGGYTEPEIALSDLSTGGTELRWDGTQFIQNWKTPKASGADLCYRAVITAKDGSTITAFFKVKK